MYLKVRHCWTAGQQQEQQQQEQGQGAAAAAAAAGEEMSRRSRRSRRSSRGRGRGRGSSSSSSSSRRTCHLLHPSHFDLAGAAIGQCLNRTGREDCHQTDSSCIGTGLLSERGRRMRSSGARRELSCWLSSLAGRRCLGHHSLCPLGLRDVDRAVWRYRAPSCVHEPPRSVCSGGRAIGVLWLPAPCEAVSCPECRHV